MAAPEVDVLATAFQTLVNGGPALIFAVLWWLERTERKEAQDRERKLTRDQLEASIRSTNAMRSLRYVFLHGRAPEPDEYEAEDVG